MSDQVTASTAAGALEYLIPVQYDPAAQTLNILHPSLSLSPGDRVIWVFQGMPSGWSPWIQFKADPATGPRSFLGPFEALTQIEGGFWGTAVATVTPGSSTYRACIQKGVGIDWQTTTALLCSAQATLEIVQERVPEPAVFFVASTAQEVAAGVGELAVTPPLHTMEAGQGILWDFQDAISSLGDPEHWRPRINFGLYEGDGSVPNQLLGPFTCLTYEAGKVTGLGNSGVAGKYHFEVSLISVSTGEVAWLSSGDPVIDNRGTVIDPVSG